MLSACGPSPTLQGQPHLCFQGDLALSDRALLPHSYGVGQRTHHLLTAGPFLTPSATCTNTVTGSRDLDSDGPGGGATTQPTTVIKCNKDQLCDLTPLQ